MAERETTPPPLPDPGRKLTVALSVLAARRGAGGRGHPELHRHGLAGGHAAEAGPGRA